MSVKVTFSNNESIIVHEKTRISAWKSLDKDPDGYYALQVHMGSNYDSEALGTSEQYIGLLGLFGNSDWFAIEPDFSPVFKTSAIVSIEEL